MLIAELASTTNIAEEDVARVLDSLADVALREAHNGFVIPGICKLELIRNDETQCRNPANDRLMETGDRSMLKITPLESVRTALAISDNDNSPATPETSRDATPTPADHETQGHILFECHDCKSTLSAAPGEAGMQGKCPYCNNPIQIPEQRKPISSKNEDPRVEPPKRSVVSETVQEFITLNCHTCSQEIEAPSAMSGMEVNCPACSSPLLIAKQESQPNVPETPGEMNASPEVDLSSMTIRIDLSDLE